MSQSLKATMGLVSLLVSPVLMPLAAQAGPAADACAAEAASQYEIGYEDIGRDSWAIEPTRAIAACTRALKSEPGSIEVKGWLGRAHFSAGDTASALPLLEEAAAGGHVVALAILGDMLITGDGVDVDMERGAELLMEGAEAGYALAQNSLGL